MIQLNDNYEDGDLQIKNLNEEIITVEKGVGNLILFLITLIPRAPCSSSHSQRSQNGRQSQTAAGSSYCRPMSGPF